MYRIAVCDDDMEFAEQLKTYILGYCIKAGPEVSLKVYTDSGQLMDAVSKKKGYDLYILDIRMPLYSGMDILERLEADDGGAEIILLTSYIGYAVDACSYKKVFRYIAKEDFRDKLGMELDAFFAEMDNRLKHKPYIIQNKIKCVKFYQEDVVYIYKDRKYVLFVLKDGRREKERCSLARVYEKMRNPDMLILDRSYIVNIPRINRIQQEEVVMDCDIILHTNRDHIQKLKAAFAAYWGELL